eukprot:403341149
MSDDDSEDDKPGNNTSDTSSYMSDNESRMYEVEETKEKAVPAEDKQMDMIDEFEENTVSSYAKFKTQNEIDLEQIDKYAPKIPELDELDDILEFGIVKKFIEDGQSNVILIQPLNPNQIYDLDNIVCFKNKQVVGFVLDLVGHINQPLYTVRVYPQFIEKLHSQNIEPKNQLIDAKIYLVAKSLKVINAQLPVILSKKGCDASNIYDEELAEHEREFSDDEKEREAKKARKNKKKLKQQQQQNSNRVMEEGEIEEEEDQILQKRKFNQSHHQNHHDNKHKGGQHQNNDFKHKKRFNEDFRQNQGQQIPMYSTNFAVNQQQNVPQMQQPAANPMQNNMMMYQQQFNNMYGQQQQYPQNAFGMAQAFQQSKTQFIWKFSLDSQMVTIELICSHLSGKKKVFRDGRVIFETQKFGTSFQYPFQINNHMLNIIQHGDHFELRIDNQSFQHLYHQDKTRREFRYDDEDKQDQDYSKSNSNANQGIGSSTANNDNGFNFDKYENYDGNKNNGIGSTNQDYGYGGYKKGHGEVQWGNNSNQSNQRSKPNDSYSPDRSNNQPAKGGTFFEQFGQQPAIKKAEYIGKQKNTDNLLEMGGSINQSQKQQSANSNFFDFDFNANANSNQQQQPQQQQQQVAQAGFDFDFNSSNQSKAFDFNSFGNQQQQTQPIQSNKSQNQQNLIESLFDQPAPQKSLDDLLGGSNHIPGALPQLNQPQNQGLNIEEQQKIQQLLTTGYSNINSNQAPSQFVPNPLSGFGSQVNQQQNPQPQMNQQFSGLGFNQVNDKENLEKKLVNLDNLGSGLVNQQTSQVRSNADPFADAFNNNQKTVIPQNNQKDAFSFVQNQLSADQQHQQQQQNNMIQQQIGLQNPAQVQVNVPQQQQQQPGNDFFFGFQENTQNQQASQQTNANFNFF